MNLEPEDNSLDQSLRDAFQDYDLPPTEHMHVWDNVARQLATPAGPSGPHLLYRVGLSVMAALGLMAGGWLLVAPSETEPEPTARVSTQLPPSAEQVVPMPGASEAAATPEPDPAPAAELMPLPLPKPAAVASKHRAPAPKLKPLAQAAPAMPNRPTSKAVVAAAPDTGPNRVAAANLTPAGVSAAPAASSPGPASTAPIGPRKPATEAAPDEDSALATVATEATAKSGKYLESEESNFKFHKPTHRLAESGTGFRRWLSRLKKNLRRIVGKD